MSRVDEQLWERSGMRIVLDYAAAAETLDGVRRRVESALLMALAAMVTLELVFIVLGVVAFEALTPPSFVGHLCGAALFAMWALGCYLAKRRGADALNSIVEPLMLRALSRWVERMRSSGALDE